MLTLASLSDFLGNLWFAGMALLLGVGLGWYGRSKYGAR
jgi:hypothetical protein